MNRAADVLDAMDVAEDDVIEFRFAKRVPGGVSIVGVPVVTCEAHSGTDAAAASRLLEPPVVNGTSVLQRMGTVVAGVMYLLRCVVTLSSGRRLTLAAFVPAVRLSP